MYEHPIACSEVEGHLPLHVGGDLEADVQGAVTQHVASCATCRGLWKRAVAAREALLSASAPSGSGVSAASSIDLWPGVYAELRRAGILSDTNSPSPAGTAGLALRRSGPVPLPPAAIPGDAGRAPSYDRKSNWLATWLRGGLVAAAACALFVLGRFSGEPGAPSTGPDPRVALPSSGLAPTGVTTIANTGQHADGALPPGAGAGSLLEPASPLGSSGDEVALTGGAEDEGVKLFEDFEGLRKLTPEERALGERAPYWQATFPWNTATTTVNAPVNGSVQR